MLKSLLITIALILFTNSTWAQAKKDTLSLSLLYGITENKNDKGYTPKGSSYRFLIGNRSGNSEFNLNFRYAKKTDEFTYSGTGGEISNTGISGGIQVGYWFFNRVNLHIGFAKHITTETLSGNFTTIQKSTLQTTYKIQDRDTFGFYGGSDIALLNFNSFQLFGNYEYYHLNGWSSTEWEAMVGMRFYFSGSKMGEGNFFVKIFKNLFEASGK